MIVPVYDSHVDSPHSERLVYALLDTQSEKSFILDETYNAFGLHGERVELSLSTMSAESMPVHSDKVRGLVVRGFDSDVKVGIPSVYSRCISRDHNDNDPIGLSHRILAYEVQGTKQPVHVAFQV